MDLSALRKKYGAGAFVALLAMTAGTSSLHATNLLTAVVSGAVTCNVQTGPGTARTITVSASPALTGTNIMAVTFGAATGGLVVTAPLSGTILSASVTSLTYAVNVASGSCAGAGNNTTVVQFSKTITGVTTADVTASVVDTVTSSTLMTATVSRPITCSTATGPGAAATITLKAFTPLAGSSTIPVTFVAAGNGLVVTTTASGTTLNAANNSTGVIYNVSAATGCVANSTATTVIQFNASGSADVTASVSDTVNTATSGLVISPTTISLTCTYTPGSPGTYAAGPTQTISITSAATGGTPFTLDTSAGNDPSWVTLSPTTLTGTANATPTTFTIRPTAGSTPCGGFASGSTHGFNIHLQNSPAGDKLIPVTLSIVAPSSLTVTPVPLTPTVSLSYVKSSGVAGIANVLVTSTVPSIYVQVVTSSLPTWLTVDNASGSAPWALRFSTSNYADSLAPGSYQASVLLRTTGYADTSLPVYLLVNNKPPRLSVNSSQINLTWTLGTPPPSYTIVATSGDSPIQYSIKTAGALAPIVGPAQLSGLAYSFGTQIGVSFDPSVFASSQPGSILTGSVTLTWGSPASTTIVAFQVTVQSPGATLSAISPQTIPTAASPSSFPIAMTGTGFVGGTDPTLKTRIGIVVGNAIVSDSNVSLTVINSSNAVVTVNVPGSPDANLPFDPTQLGGQVNLGIVNGNSSSIPTGTVTLYIGSGPIIQGITSASSFNETAPTFAPYDMISIFGSNFCASSSTGCSSSTILSGAPDPLTLRYPTALSLPAPDATGRQVSVTFQTTSGTFIASAPLLFATNNQLNAVIPAALALNAGGSVNVVVNFGFGVAPAATLLQSNAFPINIASTDPGIFTVGSDGQGSGAVLSASYALVTNTNPAGMRSTAADSDIVLIYATGLGVPASTGDNTGTSNGCIAATGAGSYEATLQSTTSVSPALTSIDGAVVQSALLNTGNLPPCLTVLPTVKIGGVAAGTVAYAGFVADSVTGLYQLNVPMPATTGTFYPNYPLLNNPITNITAPVQLPVQITVGGNVSQSGVTIWVAPRLKLVDPAGLITQNPLDSIGTTVGVAYSGTVVESETVTGTTFSYALTSGLLPTGLSLAASTGVISGKPAANTAGSYAVTITATDNTTPVALKGSVTFTITVAGGLYMISSNGAPPYSATAGTTAANVTTITSTGGQFPYLYTAPLAFSAAGTPVGMAISSPGGVISTNPLTRAGNYTVTVTAADSGTAGLSGSLTFDIDVALAMAKSAVTARASGSGLTLVTVTATGGAGTPAYALDAAGIAANLNIDPVTGIVDPGTAIAGTYSITVTATDGTVAPGAASAGVGSIGPFNVTVN
jgi:uncharacterized protein (TIGR03437 family)